MVNADRPVIILAGSDTFSKEKALAALTASILGAASRDLDLKVFRGDHSSAREIIDQLTTIPFLAPRRLVIVKEFDVLPAEDRRRVAAYAAKPSATACLVLEVAGDELPDEFAAQAKQVSVQVFGQPAPASVPAWITRFVVERKKTIEPAAITALRESCPPDFARLSQELEKLVTYIGTRPTIKVADVEALGGKGLVESAFALTNAIEDNRLDRALAVATDLLAGGKKHHEVIGLLQWHVKRLMKAKTMQKKGATETYIAQSMKINQKYFGKFFRQVKSLSMDAIRQEMRVLLEADLDMKRSRLEPALALECAIIRLCLGR